MPRSGLSRPCRLGRFARAAAHSGRCGAASLGVRESVDVAVRDLSDAAAGSHAQCDRSCDDTESTSRVLANQKPNSLPMPTRGITGPPSVRRARSSVQIEHSRQRGSLPIQCRESGNQDQQSLTTRWFFAAYVGETHTSSRSFARVNHALHWLRCRMPHVVGTAVAMSKATYALLETT
jgi:hypothetical protein